LKKGNPNKELKKARSKLQSAESELEALRHQVAKLEQAADAAEDDSVNEGKRGMLQAAWAAPVILSVNLPNAVFAQSVTSPVGTPAPSGAPTSAPTSAPILAPTTAPAAP